MRTTIPGQRKLPRLCVSVDDTGCTRTPAEKSIPGGKVYRFLKKQRVKVSPNEQRRFVHYLNRSVRHRQLVARQWEKNRLKAEDIIRLIHDARDEGDLDEAIWRTFLAAHFGRPSANPAVEDQLESAALLLCGFGPAPKWTWNKVRSDRRKFRNWLYDHANDLELLSFGNHRKYESKKPDNLWEVIEAFIDIAVEYGGPKELFAVEAGDDDFDLLYRRLSRLHRFGRTGCFDFLVMLLDLGLIDAEPRSSYLRGATGPLSGAKTLWGKRGIQELELLAVELADRLGVSPIIVEDALCNWQK